MANLTTIRSAVTVQGVGLHGGELVRLTLRPAAVGTGLRFVRSDLGGAVIPARLGHLARCEWATTLAADGATVGTVEHVLSAVYAAGIDDLILEVDGPEVPILDGSSAPFLALLDTAGRRDSGVARRALRILRPVRVGEADRWLAISPGAGLQVSYTIDFAPTAIGHSARAFQLDSEAYARDIAPARTFCRLEEVEGLRRSGLALGGSLDNAVVVDGERILNDGLRFNDEFVRHKILDLLGDLALLGAPLQGSIVAWRAGHALHARLMAELLERRDAWTLVPTGATAIVPRPSPPLPAQPSPQPLLAGAH